MPDNDRHCLSIREKWADKPHSAKFCAEAANGRRRCKKDTCWLIEQDQLEAQGRLPLEEQADAG